MVVLQDTCEKLHEVNAGTPKKTTFFQAIKNKYVDQELLEDKLVLPKDENIDTEITFVGFGKVITVQQQLSKLTSIDLSNQSIETLGDLTGLRSSMNRVKTLDLANNLLTWPDVISILRYLPNLKELILTKNKLFTECTCDIDPQVKPCNHLASLTIGRINSDWRSIIKKLSRIWFSVGEIDLWDNNLTNESMILSSTSEFDLFTSQIRCLKLTHNRFTELAWLNNAGNLSSLVELDISRCELKLITISAKVATMLANLETLNISYNNLENWAAVSDIHLLTNIKHLICVENPYFIKEKYARPYTIGRLRGLTRLNREEITLNQRRDSEILYLRTTFPEYQSFTTGQNKDFQSLHPRYDELLKIYGIPEDLIKRQVVDKYVTLEFRFKDRRLTKKLPCDMRISNVKMLCKRLFNLQPSIILKIICHDDEPTKSVISYELDKEGQTLHFFSVKNGQILVVEEVGY